MAILFSPIGTSIDIGFHLFILTFLSLLIDGGHGTLTVTSSASLARRQKEMRCRQEINKAFYATISIFLSKYFAVSQGPTLLIQPSPIIRASHIVPGPNSRTSAQLITFQQEMRMHHVLTVVRRGSAGTSGCERLLTLWKQMTEQMGPQPEGVGKEMY